MSISMARMHCAHNVSAYSACWAWWVLCAAHLSLSNWNTKFPCLSLATLAATPSDSYMFASLDFNRASISFSFVCMRQTATIPDLLFKFREQQITLCSFHEATLPDRSSNHTNQDTPKANYSQWESCRNSVYSFMRGLETGQTGDE